MNIKQLTTDNIDAIAELYAAPPDPEVFKKYRGSGIFKEAGIFSDRVKPQWLVQARKTLKLITSEREYESLLDTGLFNSHYTKQEVVDFIWEYLDNLIPEKQLRVIDPGCGTGCFWWRKPKELFVNSSYTGVDKCPVVCKLGKGILAGDDKAEIHWYDFKRYVAIAKVKGYQFDLVVGNFPFVGSEVSTVIISEDKRLKAGIEVGLHAKFLALSLELLKPGGIIAVLTSTSLLDASGSTYLVYRRWLDRQADLVEAIRLPSGRVFYGDSDAPCDFVVFRKK